MIDVTVRAIMGLAELAGGQNEQVFEIGEGSNVRTLLHAFIEAHGSGLKGALLDKSSDMKHGVSIFVNGVSILALKGLNTELRHGDGVLILPALGDNSAPTERKTADN